MQPTRQEPNVLAAAATAAKDGDKATGELLEEYNRIPDRLRWSRCGLVIFEFWNLSLFQVAVVAPVSGFNYIIVCGLRLSPGSVFMSAFAVARQSAGRGRRLLVYAYSRLTRLVYHSERVPSPLTVLRRPSDERTVGPIRADADPCDLRNRFQNSR